MTRVTVYQFNWVFGRLEQAGLLLYEGRLRYSSRASKGRGYLSRVSSISHHAYHPSPQCTRRPCVPAAAVSITETAASLTLLGASCLSAFGRKHGDPCPQASEEAASVEEEKKKRKIIKMEKFNGRQKQSRVINAPRTDQKKKNSCFGRNRKELAPLPQPYTRPHILVLVGSPAPPSPISLELSLPRVPSNHEKSPRQPNSTPDTDDTSF